MLVYAFGAISLYYWGQVATSPILYKKREEEEEGDKIRFSINYQPVDIIIA